MNKLGSDPKVEDISDINSKLYDQRKYSYGKVNRNRQMYLLDADLMEPDANEEEKQSQNKSPEDQSNQK
jgi:hypothetical protein